MGRGGRDGGWEEDPRGLQRRRLARNPEEVIRRPVTSLVQSSKKRGKKGAHWHDVILHMSALITATRCRLQKCKTCLVYLCPIHLPLHLVDST